MQFSETLRSIGTVTSSNGLFQLVMDDDLKPALLGLSEFSHLMILWWADQSATQKDRETLQFASPYRNSKDTVGVLATRSPARPNPIGLSTVELISVDEQTAALTVPYIDAEPGTSILDIKPYFPASDRVLRCTGPDWCKHWPQSYEASADFDWSAEFV